MWGNGFTSFKVRFEDEFPDQVSEAEIRFWYNCWELRKSYLSMAREDAETLENLFKKYN